MLILGGALSYGTTSNKEGVLSHGFQFLDSILLFGMAVIYGSYNVGQGTMDYCV